MFKALSVSCTPLGLVQFIEDAKQMDIVNTDFSKEFDLIIHQIILKKVIHFGVQSPLSGLSLIYRTAGS